MPEPVVVVEVVGVVDELGVADASVVVTGVAEVAVTVFGCGGGVLGAGCGEPTWRRT